MRIKGSKVLQKKIWLIVSPLLLVCFFVQAAPIVLNDSMMERVSAGSVDTVDGGGMIVGNNSAAYVVRGSKLTLSEEVQLGAQGFNLVNSTESAVANTANIWDGSVVASTTVDSSELGLESGLALEVNQINQVAQQQSHTATLTGYLRTEADKLELIEHSGSESFVGKVSDTNKRTDLFEETRISRTKSASSVDTLTKFSVGDKFSVEANLGQGIAIAGQADIKFKGGSADIAASLGGGITVEVDTASVNQSINELVGLDFGETGVKAGVEVKAGLSLLVQLELPETKMTLNGAGCGVVMGSCNAFMFVDEYTHTKTDTSTLHVVENLQSGNRSFSELHTLIYRSPFEIESAKAEYIIVDDSILKIDSELVLELTDSAQKEIEGMNIVNALGSNVANGVNVSRTATARVSQTGLVLNQFNSVHHGY